MFFVTRIVSEEAALPSASEWIRMINDYLRIGVITAPHGVRGEVKVFPTTDEPERFEDLESVWLYNVKSYVSLDIESVKYFKNMVILKVKQIPDRNEAEKYRSKELYVDREHALPLEEDEYYICDIIGAKVITDTEEEFGTLTDVLQTGANDVYVVKMKDGNEVLLPVIKECVLDVDVENGIVKVHIMPGLV